MNLTKIICAVSFTSVGFAADMGSGGNDEGDKNPGRKYTDSQSAFTTPTRNSRSAVSTPVNVPRSEVNTPVNVPRSEETDLNFITPPRPTRAVAAPVLERRNGVDNVREMALPEGAMITGSLFNSTPNSILGQIDAYVAENPLRTYTQEEQARLRFREDGSSYLEPETPVEAPVEMPVETTTHHLSDFSKVMTELFKAYKKLSFTANAIINALSIKDVMFPMNTKKSDDFTVVCVNSLDEVVNMPEISRSSSAETLSEDDDTAAINSDDNPSQNGDVADDE